MDGWVIMDTKGDAMKTRTVREFEENAPDLLQSKDPILVTRRGRLAGVFFHGRNTRCASSSSANSSRCLVLRSNERSSSAG